MAFHDFNTGYGFTVASPRLAALFFGILFYIYHGVWTHVVLQVVVAFLTGGFSIVPMWVAYAIMAPTILSSHYSARGYTPFTMAQLRELERQQQR